MKRHFIPDEMSQSFGYHDDKEIAMGQNSSQIPEQELERLTIESGLSRKGIFTLYNRFMSLATHRDKTTNEYFLTKGDFQSNSLFSPIPGKANMSTTPHQTCLICGDTADSLHFGALSCRVLERRKVYFRDFVKVLSHFRPINKNKPHPWNSREAKLRFAFTMYDLNKSGTITKDEFQDILQMMIGANVPAEQVNSIADRTMREADRDSDGFITFQEFCNAMEKTDIEQKMSFRFLT
uniref:EF-hand domain-containing protein n=2 Tax=Caenorhabditis japonica TaxID=281687 RepID=A0A8R1IUT9_CAEJA